MSAEDGRNTKANNQINLLTTIIIANGSGNGNNNATSMRGRQQKKSTKITNLQIRPKRLKLFYLIVGIWWSERDFADSKRGLPINKL